MNRLQKKCFIVSMSFHGLLVLILIFGSALMPRPSDADLGFHPIHLFTAAQVSDALTGGRGPELRIDAPAPTPPPEEAQTPVADPADPEPPAKPEPAPVPVKSTPKQISKPVETKVKRKDIPKAKDKPKFVEEKQADPVKTPPVKSAINPDELKRVKRKPSPEDAQAEKDAKKQAATAADARRKAAKQFASAIRNISSTLSTDAVVDINPGHDGSGEAVANYRDIIASTYYNAWIAPSGLEDDTPVVTVRVTISRDGTVKTAHIITASGNRVMDRSIQNTLESVTFIQAFPSGSQDQERTVTIQFNLQAKRQLG